MTLREAIEKAIRNQDAAAAGGVADFCRFRMGLDYQETAALVQRVCPEANPASWEALLYEADTQ